MRFTSIFYCAVALAPLFTKALVVPDSSGDTKVSTNTTSSKVAAKPDYLELGDDLFDISSRDIEALEKRVGEEYWFRFDDPKIAEDGNFLELAPRAGAKDYDDQAYKWISRDASKVARSSIKGRIPTLYVLPAGTRAALGPLAKDFETVSEAKQRADYVEKAHEPGDLGIQGISPNAKGVLPLDDFRKIVVRAVIKFTSAKAGGKTTYKTIDGKTRKIGNVATQDDQKALQNFS